MMMKGKLMSDNEGASPQRVYVVLERQRFDDGDEYFVKVHETKARNAANALRKGFRELRELGFEASEATIVCIPATMWRPTEVAATSRETIRVGSDT